ncbi:MAG: hypothetical protein H0V25_02590 [Solirubrobacterales bacterium]|nr:hypothetical protein [Solirubrobacterales bacterium]
MTGKRKIGAIAATAATCGGLLLAGTGGASAERDAVARGFDSTCGSFPSAEGVPPGSPSLPDQRAWNQDISQSPVDPSSDQIISYINSHGDSQLHPDFGTQKLYGIPYTVVRSQTKPVRVKFRYRAESDPGKYKIPLKAPIEGGPKGDGDRHVVAYDTSGCKLYELFDAQPRDRSWKAGSGAIWDLTSAGLRTPGFTSADAAGLPIFPGLVRYDEVAEGGIDHAIRVTFESTRNAYINPASHCAGDTDSPAAPSMGLRLRLEATYDTSSLSGQAAVIAAALKRYGMINADNGSNWFISGSSNKGWSNGQLNQLKTIPGSAFEVVQSQAAVETC